MSVYGKVPRRWRIKVGGLPPSCGAGLHPNGSNAEYFYGCYFPQTDLNVGEMGGRGTGMPGLNVEWLDPVTEEWNPPAPPQPTLPPEHC